MSIEIYNTQEIFLFRKDNFAISWSKVTKLFKIEKDFQSLVSSNSTKFNAHSVVGFIEAFHNSYIVTAKEVQPIGELLTAKVFKITKFEYIPKDIMPVSDEDAKYLKMLTDFLKRNALYYSDSLDLTISFDKYKASPSYSTIFKYTVPHFCWNFTIAKILDNKGMNEFVFPIINGFVGISKAPEYSSEVSFALIGRKDTRRSGMRFLLRGADANGNVANFVEIEEAVIFKDKTNITNILSMVQIRGSIPLIWTQEPNFELNPLILPKDDFNLNTEVFNHHMDDIIATYGNVCCINLIDKKKNQKIIGDYFQTLATNYKENVANQNSSKLDFVWFDFHQECKKMRYQNLSKLLKANSVNKGINGFGYTHIQIDYTKLLLLDTKLDFVLHDKGNLTYLKNQTGVFRTNCIDCLDRTNVVQSSFGRYFLQRMLKDIGLNQNVTEDPFQSFFPSFEKVFKYLWADLGDALSLAYSGTGAMKSDFVRGGKRTLKGNLMDGYLSCKRFYINNFTDGYNQDCSDYFLGIILPKKNNFKQHNINNLKIMIPLVFLIAYIMGHFLTQVSIGREPTQGKTGMKLYKMILYFGSFILSAMVIFGNLKKSLIDLHTRHSS